jgi:zinc protease
MEISKLDPENVSFILDRSRQPQPGKPKDIRFPSYYETGLSNGMTLIVIEDKKLPLVTARFVFRSGAYLDAFSGYNKSGVASLTSELLTKGTSKYSASEIAEKVDYFGAVISTGCDYDASYLSVYSLKKHFNDIFDLASEIILDPAFSEEEIKRAKEQRQNSLLSYKDDGDYLAETVFKKYVYDRTPYANPVEGTESSVTNINRNDFFNFYKNVYCPGNLIVAFVGDITPECAVDMLESRFGSWEKETIPSEEIKEPVMYDKRNIYVIKKKGAVQSSLKMGHIGIKRNNPDFIRLHVMNTLLGGSFTSRINKNLREVHGYTYGSRSNFNWKKYSGDFCVETDVKTDITLDAINEILNELEKIKNEYVSEEELQNVKNYISGNFPLQLETPNAIASKVISLKLYGLEHDYYNTFISNVNKVSIENIKTMAEKYIHPDKIIISAAGNSEVLYESLKPLGDVSVTDV